ncbi:unnamed protein product, partial [Notodromas monacha]
MTIKAGLTLCFLVCAILGHGVFCAPVAVADNDGGDGGNERSGGVIVPGDAPWDRDAFAPGMGRWTTLGKGILQLQVPCLSFPFLGSSAVAADFILPGDLYLSIYFSESVDPLDKFFVVRLRILFLFGYRITESEAWKKKEALSGEMEEFFVPREIEFRAACRKLVSETSRRIGKGKELKSPTELARQFKIPSAIFDENEIMRRRQIHGFVDGLPSEADEAESFSDDFSQPHFESERNTERNDVVEMDTAEEIIQTDSAPE